jgi:hypothetical protein
MNLVQTRKSVLPYEFLLCDNGTVRIVNTRGQVLFVSRSQVEHQLQREDLDAHRRRMYEAALEMWKKNDQVQQ